MTSEESLSKFKEYVLEVSRYHDEFLSESDTRCKFIDRLFIDCLGWNELNIRREIRVSVEGGAGFVDYIFRTHMPILVVEAKRKNVIFQFPSDGKRKYKINGVISKIKELHDAINQAREYAASHSVKYAIVTNGSQLITFIATRTDGIPWDEGDCIIFRSLDDINDNYVDFYNILYSTEFINHSLDKILLISPVESKGVRLLDQLENPDDTIFRNAFSDAMYKMIDNYFSDIVDLTDSDALQNCYVLNSEINLYENNLESLLKDNLPPLIKGIKRIILKPFKSKEEIEEDLESYSQGNTTRIPILLIGGLGVGKSTFLRWFFNTKLKNDIRSKIYPITIDFLKGPPNESLYAEYVQERVIETLESDKKYNLSEWNKLQAIYRDKIKSEEKGLLRPLAEKNRDEFTIKISQKIESWKVDKFSHMGRLIKYLETHHGIRVVVIFDNADQKELDFQNKIYQYANMITMSFKCLTIISLREESYWQGSRVGTFDAYHTHVYHLRAPRFKELLQRRLEFALDKIKKEKGEYYSSFGAFKVKITDLQAFLELMMKSILVDSRGIEILKFMECLACHNMRMALTMFKIFLTSGHTKMDDYIKGYMLKTQHSVPFHEFARSVMLQDFKYYSESRNNIVINLFSIGKGAKVSYFTRIRLLEVLSQNQNISSSVGKGYYKINDIFMHFIKLNYDQSYISEHLNTLLKYNLIETDNNIRSSIDNSEYIKITACGEYYLRYLVERFIYLDVIITDMPFFSMETFGKIKSIFVKEIASGKRNVDMRLQAAEILLDYLSATEQQEIDILREIDDSAFLVNFTNRIKESFNKEKEYIMKALEKMKN